MWFSDGTQQVRLTVGLDLEGFFQLCDSITVEKLCKGGKMCELSGTLKKKAPVNNRVNIANSEI